MTWGELARMGLPVRVGRTTVTVRWLGGWRWEYDLERFLQGDVYRMWVGPFLFKVMVKKA